MLQVYTGNGKGKTCAALGMALRAAGAGFKVFIAQFMKKGSFSEVKALSRFKDFIELKQFGTGKFIVNAPGKKEVALAQKGLEEAKNAMLSGKYRVIILDEANCAVEKGLLTIQNLLDFIALKPANVELIITGRNVDKNIIAIADLVTEMKEIKHYSKNGVKARKGFEF